MKILLLHNRYQIAGGEDTAFRQEVTMLCDAGHTVDVLEVNNDDITTVAQRIKTAAQVLYSSSSSRLVADRIAQLQPDIAHVHNFFPRLSPSIYDACRDAAVPVVQTLHNYRLVCANALLFREDEVCTECLGHTIPYPAVVHGCYRQSRLGTVPVAAMIGFHRLRRTWANRVDRFIALTEFARDLFVTRAGIPAEHIAVKPNAVADPGIGDGSGGYALYVGRLSPEKGIDVLLRAAADGAGILLKIAGTGPLQQRVQRLQIPGRIEYLGWQEAEGIRRLMREARVLVLPSLWYEGLPMVVPEALGTGLPIIASNIGALSTLIDDGRNGLLIPPGDAAAFANALRRAASDPAFAREFRHQARLTYDSRYRPDMNLHIQMQIYEAAIQTHLARVKKLGRAKPAGN